MGEGGGGPVPVPVDDVPGGGGMAIGVWTTNDGGDTEGGRVDSPCVEAGECSSLVSKRSLPSVAANLRFMPKSEGAPLNIYLLLPCEPQMPPRSLLGLLQYPTRHVVSKPPFLSRRNAKGRLALLLLAARLCNVSKDEKKRGIVIGCLGGTAGILS